MDSIELIRDNLIRSAGRVLSRIEDMKDHGFVFPTPNGGSHTIWVLGHLATIEGMVIHRFMLGEPNPLSRWEELFDGADIRDEPDAYPSFAEVLAQCRDMRALTMAVLDGFSEADLDRSSTAAPEGSGDLFGTYRHCLQFVADHAYMHRGQLADARRVAGVDRMWF